MSAHEWLLLSLMLLYGGICWAFGYKVGVIWTVRRLRKDAAFAVEYDRVMKLRGLEQ